MQPHMKMLEVIHLIQITFMWLVSGPASVRQSYGPGPFRGSTRYGSILSPISATPLSSPVKLPVLRNVSTLYMLRWFFFELLVLYAYMYIYTLFCDHNIIIQYHNTLSMLLYCSFYLMPNQFVSIFINYIYYILISIFLFLFSTVSCYSIVTANSNN